MYPGWDYYVYVELWKPRYDLLMTFSFQTTSDGEAHPSQELRGELCVQASQAPYHAHQVVFRDLTLQYDSTCYNAL